MKTKKAFRTRPDGNSDEVMKKAVKLAPIKKSGKERHHLYSELEQDDDPELVNYKERESVLDYFDDPEEDF